MMPSLYSGISGLNAHQQRLNVTGNNVANVNTIGYKSSFTTFKEAAVVTTRSPGPSTPGLQSGLGVNLSGITRRFTAGMLSESGQPTNMAINGEGWFVVQTAAGANLMTRAGDFVLDIYDDGGLGQLNLITSDGHRVLNENLDPIDLTPASGENLASFSVDSNGVITLVDVAGNVQTLDGPGERVKVAMFQNNNGLQAEGANLYSWTTAAGEPVAAAENVAASGAILQGYLESSNTDLASEFTDMIVGQRGFQANARTITTSDEILQELMSIKR